MKSMTGFGRGEHTSGGVRYRVEIASVNRKQSDIVVNLPREFSELEVAVRTQLSEIISRGRVVVHIACENTQSAGSSNTLVCDTDLARQYRDAFQSLSKVLPNQVEISAADLIRAPGVFTVQESEKDADEVWPLIEKALKKAVVQFEKSRRDEGSNLKLDLDARLKEIRTILKTVEKEAPKVTKTYRANLLKRLEEAGLPLDVDDEKILKEVGVFAERCDISEETTRIDSHLKQFSQYLKAKEPVGRPMDFLAQELNREFNTVGSKANNASIAQQVVCAKTEVEKVREQVQNVE